MSHVIAGRLNKQIASDLGTVEKTVKVHRGRVMSKLGVRSVIDLVRLAEKAGISWSESPPSKHRWAHSASAAEEQIVRCCAPNRRLRAQTYGIVKPIRFRLLVKLPLG